MKELRGGLCQSDSGAVIPRSDGNNFRPVCQRSPNPPEFAQPRLSRPNGGHPQREGTHLGVFVPKWLVLPKCEATNLGVFDLRH